MKSFFLYLMVSSTLIACNSNSNNASVTKDSLNPNGINNEDAKEERNKQVVKASTEAYRRRDVEAVAKYFSTDVMDYVDESLPPVRGVDSFKYNRYQFFKAFPDMEGENLHYAADGDWVIVWGDWSATWKGDFAGQKATGKSFKVQLADIFKFNEAGKIVEHRGTQSRYEIAYQIGLRISNP